MATYFKKNWLDQFGLEVVLGKWEGICIATDDQMLSQSSQNIHENFTPVSMEQDYIDVGVETELQNFIEITSRTSEHDLQRLKYIEQSSRSVSSESNVIECIDVDEETLVYVLGPNGNTVPIIFYQTIVSDINMNPSQMTRKLLSYFFTRDILATHSLSGKPSPAFKEGEKPSKGQLDPNIIEDITEFVCQRTNCTKRHVRVAITTKCADENKIWRNKNIKRMSQAKEKDFINRKNSMDQSCEVSMYFIDNTIL